MRACGNFAFGDVAAMVVLVLLGLASMIVGANGSLTAGDVGSGGMAAASSAAVVLFG